MTIKKQIPTSINVKTIIIVLLGIILLIAVGVGIKQLTKVDKTGFGTDKTACQILTNSLVKQTFGKDTDLVLDKNKTNEVDNSGIKTSTCTYKEKGGDDGSELIATLTIHSAQSKAGITNVKTGFIKATHSNQVTVHGYDGSGYWNPANGEINVLNKGTWYSFRSGSDKPNDPVYADTQKLGNTLAPQMR